ncbi:MAG: polyprenyl synthetase family protein [Schwartzia sp.]|nr:polyprenyl synthetase family protein [Schwartzia sp. (in: firmicutes)]
MFQIIKRELATLEEELLRAVSSPVPLLQEMGTHLVRSGGKRLRPALYLLAARSGPAFKESRMMPLAVAIEIIHMASLVHDDVIDSADTRRGSPTANARWGNQAAILGGDFLFAQAFTLVSGRDYGEEIAVRLAELVRELSTGEILQDSSLYQAGLSEASYYERIEKKTAHFLALCSEMGALVAQAPEAVARGLYKYGHAIGMAFQLTDDLLDITGDAAKLGKPAGNDIRQGVVTLPVLRALAQSPDRAELTAIVTDEAMTDAMVERALSIVRASDGVAYAQAKADEYLAQAKAALPEPLPEAVRRAFIKAADYIGRRDF